MHTVDTASRTYLPKIVKEKTAVGTSEVSAGTAARQGQKRVPAAARLNPKFIGNVPSSGYAKNELVYNPAAHLAA